MATENRRTQRVQKGNIDVWVDEDGICRVSWLPDEPYPDGEFSGRTYTPGDPDLPNDFPSSNDPDEVLAWAVARWGP